MINDFNGIIFITNIINDHMRTPKIYSLYKLIDWLNNRFNLSIVKKELDDNPINYNCWLSGFIDDDGQFSVRITISSKYPKLECKFELCQRQIDHNNCNNYAL